LDDIREMKPSAPPRSASPGPGRNGGGRGPQLPPRLLWAATFVVTAVLTTLASFWLWREAPLYAAVLCGFILFGAARSLPSRQGFAYCFSLGFGIGIVLGGAVGAARLLLS
jgi:hypothetical protein